MPSSEEIPMAIGDLAATVAQLMLKDFCLDIYVLHPKYCEIRFYNNLTFCSLEESRLGSIPVRLSTLKLLC